MSNRPVKRVQDSYTVQVHILHQLHLNGYQRLFGGQLMMWMDEVAGITARRHSGRNVTTACVEKLDFHAAAYANDTLVLTGRIVQVGRTSMTVLVHVYVEALSGERRLINEAHFVMVALDENERPTEVPDILIDTDQEREQQEIAEFLRKALR